MNIPLTLASRGPGIRAEATEHISREVSVAVVPEDRVLELSVSALAEDRSARDICDVIDKSAAAARDERIRLDVDPAARLRRVPIEEAVEYVDSRPGASIEASALIGR